MWKLFSRIMIGGTGSPTSNASQQVESSSFQVVRPHIAMIKFPPRIGGHVAYSPSMAPQVSSSSSSQITAAPVPSAQLADSYQKPIGTTPRGSGVESRHLPPHLQRRPMDQSEVDYINRGGPE